MFKRPRQVIPLMLIAALFPVISFAMVVYDPWDTYQNTLTAVNSATQVKQQLEQIQYEVKNLNNISDYQWRDITGLIQQLDQLTQQGQSLAYASSNVDAQFRQRYPNYVNSPYGQTNYQQAYNTWTNTTLDTLQSTLSTSGMELSNFQNEQNTLMMLKNQGQTAQGRMQALQVATEMSAETVNQLQELKQLTASQAASEDSYMAYEVSKDTYDQNALNEIDSHIDTHFPAYQNNPNFGDIPDMS